MEITSLIIGLIAGGIITAIIIQLQHKATSVSKSTFDELSTRCNSLEGDLRVATEKANTLQQSNDALMKNISQKEYEVQQIRTEVTTLKTNLTHRDKQVGELNQKYAEEQSKKQSLQGETNKFQRQVAELEANHKSLTSNLHAQQEMNKKQGLQIEELQESKIELTGQVHKLNSKNQSLEENLKTQKHQVIELQEKAKLEFEKVANRILEAKTSKFTETNKSNIEGILAPLKSEIKGFKAKVEETHLEETKQRISLEERIKGLVDQTNKVSIEANNLATALKGKPQKRGNWGELILERILESSGLTKDREYFVQQSIKDDDGKTLRPDVRVNLPDDRIIVIDSKVSLIAYDKFSASEDLEMQKIFLQEHLKATRTHIDQLSRKKYDDLETSLDFTMMFIPIEPAYMYAIQIDPDLWAYAYHKRILLVSPTNLIACLKLISDLWKREWQNKNALEIAERGERLYEKFVGFATTFEDLGNSLRTSQERYDKAMGQLKDGRGNMISQAIKLKQLGLKSNKEFPERLMPAMVDEDEEEEINNNMRSIGSTHNKGYGLPLNE